MLIGDEQGRVGLERLGGVAPGILGDDAVTPESAVCMLDSTLYLRNQLLRDSDWASMAFSLELRTPLVDAFLLEELQTIQTQFINGNGKRLLAESPARPLPDSVVKRGKTGFSVPMTPWLNDAACRMNGAPSPTLLPAKTPWTRRWARVVIDSFFESPSQGYVHLKAV